MTEPLRDIPLADRGWYLAVEFEQSASPRFDRAVALAGKLPGFTVLIDEYGACVYRVLFRPADLRPLQRLLLLIAGWKKTRFYLRGREVDLEQIEAWLPCYLTRCRAEMPPCRRPLSATNPAIPVGCAFAGVSLALSDWGGWYRTGRFDAAGCFHIDREEFQRRLRSWEPLYGGCPLADPALARQVVALLPAVIDPGSDSRWRVIEYPYLPYPLLTPRGRADYLAYLREQFAPVLTPER